jgi:hypothetical protein
LDISAIASLLSFSASPTGTESASGKMNSELFFAEFLHEKQERTDTNSINKIRPFIRIIH